MTRQKWCIVQPSGWVEVDMDGVTAYIKEECLTEEGEYYESTRQHENALEIIERSLKNEKK